MIHIIFDEGVYKLWEIFGTWLTNRPILYKIIFPFQKKKNVTRFFFLNIGITWFKNVVI